MNKFAKFGSELEFTDARKAIEQTRLDKNAEDYSEINIDDDMELHSADVNEDVEDMVAEVSEKYCPAIDSNDLVSISSDSGDSRLEDSNNFNHSNLLQLALT